MSHDMHAAAATLKLSAGVLGFEVMEVHADIRGEIKTVFTYADDDIVSRYPEVKRGYSGKNDIAAPLALSLCDVAAKSPTSLYWNAVSNFEDTDEPEIGISVDALHFHCGIPLLTEMAYKLPESDLPHDVYLCGYSEHQRQYKPSYEKYLSGVVYALGVAIFDLDTTKTNPVANNTDLDVKEFLPRACTPYTSYVNLEGLGPSPTHSRNWKKPSGINLESVINSDNFLKLREEQPKDDDEYFFHSTSPLPSPECSERKTIPLPPLIPTETFLTRPINDGFSLSPSKLPVVSNCPENLKLSDIKSLQHIADGSNSNIYTGKFNNEHVVVKMLMDSAYADPVAMLEFDIEYSILCRIRHPNIVRVLGAGNSPRKFIVLEWLGGGSLDSILIPARASKTFGQKLFGRSTFNFRGLLSKARDIASAMHYLHEEVHPDATIIHRDLKPDNIGFSKDGTLKIFDFGLCSCVQKRSSSDQCYAMSGNTGSLRFMAPEVAMRQSYSEKADVYSFAIVVWQMARDRVAYRDMSKREFLLKVVVQGERPKLDKSWPKEFSALLEACWHKDQTRRPSFLSIMDTLDSLLETHKKHRRVPIPKSFRPSAATQVESTQSSWF
eukprot:CAMPEP_0182418564 /NCGR_PEP_ID=MMETSP1167-20130531/2964_1 /TAXON_ID=2988 /ORGANISM="Mallomonas Sp, Strain CCMP3275" /LENGTH=608 /DNA_ID=CAMNT_0024592827 /DNA_START=54 /DNA_END=1880 /DNA_ORIENTATION=+